MIEKKKYFIIEKIDGYSVKYKTREFFCGMEGLYESKKTLHFTAFVDSICNSLALNTKIYIEGVDKCKAEELITLCTKMKSIKEEIERVSIMLLTNVEEGE